MPLTKKKNKKMHITEGFLPHPWWEIWFIIAIPFVAYGTYKVTKLKKNIPETLPLLAVLAAFIFVLSSLKLPPSQAAPHTHTENKQKISQQQVKTHKTTIH